MNCKYCFYIKDFPDIVEYYTQQMNAIKLNIDQLLENYEVTLNLNNPLIQYYITNSLITENKVALESISLKYDANLNLHFQPNLEVYDEKIFFQEYNLDLITALKGIYLPLEKESFDVSWFYKPDIDKSKFHSGSGFIPDLIPYTQLLNRNFYLNKKEVFTSISVINKEDLPVKSNVETYLNKKEDKEITCGINEIKTTDASFFLSPINPSYVSNAVSLYADTISQKRENSLLLNKTNVSNLLPNNLNISAYSYLPIKYDTNKDYILSKQDFNELNKNVKDSNDYQIDSDYHIKNSFSNINALNYKKASELIILTIDKIYTSIIQTKVLNLELTESDKIYALYKKQLADYKNNYVVSSNDVITSYCTETNHCKELMTPLTLNEQRECVDDFVYIEESEKALTKGDYKKWLKQCLKSRIYV